MSWRTVVITETAKLDYQMGYLVVRGMESKKIPISEISMLIVESTAVSLTAYLLQELSKHKVKVIFCDERRNPSSELIPYYGSHDTSIKIRNQVDWPKDLKTAVWTKIVAEKIRQQAVTLNLFGKEEALMLESYIEEIEFGDITNREGHAAKVYFNALFGKGFNRQEDNSINAALNYGYTIILSAFNREVVSNGYITQLGLSHSNRFNPFNLASDLMEPFRPLVDRYVGLLKPEVFEKEEKHYMIRLLEEEVLMEGKSEKLPNAIKLYTKSVFDVLSNNGEGNILFFERK